MRPIFYQTNLSNFLHLLFCLTLIFLLSGCQTFGLPGFLSNDATSDISSQSSQIQNIYIQSFTGQNVDKVQDVFFETIDEQNVFNFVELLPDNYYNLKILRIEVVDYQIWENNETLKAVAQELDPTDVTSDVIKRRNAIVAIKIALYEAESGKLLLRKKYVQPFQQIYVGEEAIADMPEQDLELKRLTKLLIFRILTDFYKKNGNAPEMELEEGHGFNWISVNLHNLGDNRIKKGNRLAYSGDYEKAIWMWQLVLFRPGEEEPIGIYKLNRASAYYNLGQVYSQLGDWLSSARMFSKANRLNQKLRYAQSWGNSMQNWLDDQKTDGYQIDRISEMQKKKTALDILKEDARLTESKKQSESDVLRHIEDNEQLLLKAKELWPLEPLLKYGEPFKSESDEPVSIIEEDLPEMQESIIIQPIELGDEPSEGESLLPLP